MKWQDVKCNYPRMRDMYREDGWSLYYWGGLSGKWVLCDPAGVKAAINDEDGEFDGDSAMEWAEGKILRLLKDGYVIGDINADIASR